MDRFDKLLEKLNSKKILQNECDWLECLPEDIWIEYFEHNSKLVGWNLEVEKYRHYETSIDVYDIDNRYLGIKFISNLYSDNSTYEDCFYHLEFFEMREITVRSFEKMD